MPLFDWFDDGALNIEQGFQAQVLNNERNKRAAVELMHQLRQLNCNATFDDIVAAIDMSERLAIGFEHDTLLPL